MFDAFLTSVGGAIGTTAGEAGIILSLLGVAFFDVLVAVASGGRNAIVVSSIIGIVFFIAIDWFPAWSGAVLGLVFALIFTRETVNTILN